MRGNETFGRIVTNFCTDVGVHDVITSANFYDRRLWCLSVVGGSNFGFLHWLASSPLQHSRTTVRVCDSVIRYIVQTRSLSTKTTIDAQGLHHFFDEKISTVRKSTALTLHHRASFLRHRTAICHPSALSALMTSSTLFASFLPSSAPPAHCQRIFSKTMRMCWSHSSPNCSIGRCHPECFRRS